MVKGGSNTEKKATKNSTMELDLEKLEKSTNQRTESSEKISHKIRFNTINYWKNQPLEKSNINVKKHNKKLKKMEPINRRI